MIWKNNITLIDENWNPVRSYKAKFIPRYGELIYIEETGNYYTVINVVYNFNPKQSVFIIIKPIDSKLIKKK